MKITMLNGIGCACQERQALSGITFNTAPTSDWECQDWKFWHEELVKAFMAGAFKSRIKYSRDEAIRLSNQVFVTWWNKLVGTFSTKNFCGYESQWFAYFKSVGLESILSYFQGFFVPVATSAIKVTESATEAVSNIADAAKNTSKTAAWLIPTVLVLGTVFVGAYAYKNFIQRDNKIALRPSLSGAKRKYKPSRKKRKA